MPAEAVGIERGGLTDGAVVVGMGYGGQCLNHQPCRVVGIFNRELRIEDRRWYERGEVDGLRAWLCLCEGHGDGNALATGQNGQIVLFAITEVVACHRHLADQHRLSLELLAGHLEADGICAVCFER